MSKNWTQGTWSIIPQSNGSSMLAVEYLTGNQMQPKGLRLIAHVLTRGDSLTTDEANAARIVACVNFLAAHPDLSKVEIVPKGTLAQRDELLSALLSARPFVENYYDYQHPGEDGRTLIEVDAAIAKATEQAK